MSREILIYGAGGHARSVADVVLSNSPDAKIIFVDEAAKPDEKILGFEVVPSVPQIEDSEVDRFVAIGDNNKRKSQRDVLGHLAATEIISNDAHIGREVTIGHGVFIGHQAYIGPLVQIGEGAIINTRAIIEHEVEIGANSQVAPGVIIGGRVKVGDNVFIGMGARVADGLMICSDAKIGASSVVLENITEPGTYVGTPARKVR